MSASLFTTEAMRAAMQAKPAGALPDAITGISIDSRSIGKGEAFFAIKGDVHDGHAFVASALKNGAGLAVVAVSQQANMPAGASLLVVPDVLQGLVDLAKASRTRTKSRVIAVTGSVGKTSTKEALRVALGRNGETHASTASFNNHWGVPLSLARLHESARYAIFEIGMNHAGEITPLVKLVRPHIAIITTVAPVHLEFFASVEEIADAKAEIFLGLEPGGAAVLNRDNAQFARLRQRAEAAGVARIVAFGEHREADARLLKLAMQPESSTVDAEILGQRITYKLGMPGQHHAINSLAVLAAASLAGADLALTAMALAEVTPAAGRGTRIRLDLHPGSALLIDESYNANPTSMRAALGLLAQARVTPPGRRIAVLGDMLELGPAAEQLHRDLTKAVIENKIDLVFCAGEMMEALWQALPSERRGGYAKDSATLESSVVAAVRDGDAIMVKGSAGSKMAPIVKTLATRYGREAERPAARAES